MRVLLCVWVLGWIGTAVSASPDVVDVALGEAVFREGLLSNGEVLHGGRRAGGGVDGPAAACAACHRRSGLGMAEGSIEIPPIVGDSLFRASVRRVEGINQAPVRLTRRPYSAQTLARAIRDGVDSNDRQLNYLMPRYNLDDRTMASLTAYLRQLNQGPVRGVDDDSVHFATIITPDADKAQRLAVLEVIQHYFAEHNSSIRGAVHVAEPAREPGIQGVRRWQLHVWELLGAADTWEAQLRAKLAKEPVFAAIAGLGGSEWAPVHRFCEQASLPCLLPNVELPVVSERDFYPVYLSRGLWLEADLMNERLVAKLVPAGVARVIQIFRDNDSGQAAAYALRETALAAGLNVDMRPLPSSAAGGPELEGALHTLGTGDVLVLWLRAADLAALPAKAPAVDEVLISGTMGGLEHAPMPPAWSSITHMTYPFELPDRRRVRMNFPLAWFRKQQIALGAVRLQADTYLACAILSETMSSMLNLLPDYLVERVEDMLSHRLVNGYYPRLSLAPRQRFASKGGYIVHFAGPTGTEIAADTEWIVP